MLIYSLDFSAFTGRMLSVSLKEVFWKKVCYLISKKRWVQQQNLGLKNFATLKVSM
jgi:hypothetical protein